MTKKNLFSFVVILPLFLFFSCGEATEIVTPDNYLQIGNKEYKLKDTELIDNGVVEGNYSFRSYKITLKTNSSYPEAYIEYYLNSSSTSKIDDRTYTYDIYDKQGCFTSSTTAMNVKWENGFKINGIYYTEYDLDLNYNNTIKVTTEGDNKAFDINLKYIKDGDTISVKAYYEGALSQVN